MLLEEMSVKDHWKKFLEFSQLELGTGGPDPYLKLAAKGVSQASSREEQVWRAACFIAPYEVNTGSVLWSEWPLQRALSKPEELEPWIRDNWKGLIFRRERRAARTPKKMAISLRTAAAFAESITNRLDDDYETLWGLSDKALMYYGRYALIKFLEVLYRAKTVSSSIPDIRPIGAWSPRTTLTWLYPSEDKDLLIKSNKPPVLNRIQEMAKEIKLQVTQKVKHPVSYYDIEVMLCNYRQALGWRFPGRSLDTDLGYYARTKEYWGDRFTFPLLTLRRNNFPSVVLGERQGWTQRKELESTYENFGYFWCDLLYDYKATTDLSLPVRRNKNEVVFYHP